jgi:hypothetical protein
MYYIIVYTLVGLDEICPVIHCILEVPASVLEGSERGGDRRGGEEGGMNMVRQTMGYRECYQKPS